MLFRIINIQGQVQSGLAQLGLERAGASGSPSIRWPGSWRACSGTSNEIKSFQLYFILQLCPVKDLQGTWAVEEGCTSGCFADVGHHPRAIFLSSCK